MYIQGCSFKLYRSTEKVLFEKKHAGVDVESGGSYKLGKGWKRVCFECCTWVNLSEGTDGGNLRWCSTYSPLLGFLCFKMKWTLLVAPHLSGPNMIKETRCRIPWRSSQLLVGEDISNTHHHIQDRFEDELQTGEQWYLSLRRTGFSSSLTIAYFLAFSLTTSP